MTQSKTGVVPSSQGERQERITIYFRGEDCDIYDRARKMQYDEKAENKTASISGYAIRGLDQLLKAQKY